MGVWILDGVVYHSSLLEFALKKESLKNTLALIVVDLSKPWSIMESLECWVEVLSKHIDSLHISPSDMAEMEKSCELLLTVVVIHEVILLYGNLVIGALYCRLCWLLLT